MVFSPLIAATATFALNAGLWFRRGRLAMVFSSLAASCCRYAENPLIPAVQISAATSKLAILIINHSLDHVFRLSDRICVLRRGQQIDVRDTARTDKNEIIAMITGLAAA